LLDKNRSNIWCRQKNPDSKTLKVHSWFTSWMSGKYF